MADPQIQPILDPLNVPKNVKADAWDAFHSATSPEDFQAKFDKLQLPKEVKAQLWDAKFSNKAAQPAVDLGNQALAQYGLSAKPPQAQYPQPQEVSSFRRILHSGPTMVPAETPMPGSFEGKPENVAETLHDTPLLAGPAELVRQNIQANQDSPNMPPWYRNVVAPAAQGGADFIEGMSAPSTMATLGATKVLGAATPIARTLQRGAQSYFGYQMGKGAVQGATEAVDKAQAGDVPGAVRAGTGAAFNAAMAADTAKGLAQSRKGAVTDLKDSASQVSDALPGVAPFAREALANKLRDSAVKQYEKVINPTTKQNKNITAQVVPQLLDKGVIAASPEGLAKKAGAQAQEAGQRVGEVWDNLPADTKAEVKPMIDHLNDYKSEFQNTVEITPQEAARLAADKSTQGSVNVTTNPDGTERFTKTINVDPDAVSAIEQLQKMVAEHGDTISAANLRKVRDVFEKKVAKAGGYAGIPMAEGSKVDAAEELSKVAREQISKFDPNMRKANQDFSFWKNVERVAKATAERRVGQQGGLKKLAYGAAGAVIGSGAGPHGTVAGLEAGKAVSRIGSSAIYNTTAAVAKNKLANVIRPRAVKPLPGGVEPPTLPGGGMPPWMIPQGGAPQAGQPALPFAKPAATEYPDGTSVDGVAPPQMVGTPQGALTDTAFFERAKAKMPEGTPISAVAMEAQRLKLQAQRGESALPWAGVSKEVPESAVSKVSPETAVSPNGESVAKVGGKAEALADLKSTYGMDESAVRKAVEDAGATYNGIWDASASKNGLQVQVTDKKTGMTITLPVDKLSPEYVRGAIDARRQQFEADAAAAKAKSPKAQSAVASGEVAAQGVPAPGKTGDMKVSDIAQNPGRFQYKLNTDAAGVGTLLKEQTKFNPDLAGVITVWRDPADGKTYVVNGHHRLELAKRTGQDTVTVRHVVANDAGEARAIGALQNIAEGRGTPIDAAKFMRDSGITLEDLKAKGISLGEATAAKGAALSHLDDGIFAKVVSGDMPVERAVTIGEATADHAEQRAIAELVDKSEKKGKRITNETLSELIRFVKGSDQKVETTSSLFGEESVTKSLALEKAEVSAYIKSQLSKDKKLFGYVSKESRASELERGNNIIDVATSKKVATEAAQGEEIYNKLSNRGGPIADILDNAAERLANGENASKVKQEAYDDIRTELSQTLGGSQGAGSGSGKGTAKRDFSVGGKEDKANYSVRARRGELDWAGGGLSPEQLQSWSKSKSLAIEEGGEQGSLLGEPDKMYRIQRLDSDGQPERALITEKQLQKLIAGGSKNVVAALMKSGLPVPGLGQQWTLPRAEVKAQPGLAPFMRPRESAEPPSGKPPFAKGVEAPRPEDINAVRDWAQNGASGDAGKRVSGLIDSHGTDHPELFRGINLSAEDAAKSPLVSARPGDVVSLGKSEVVSATKDVSFAKQSATEPRRTWKDSVPVVVKIKGKVRGLEVNSILGDHPYQNQGEVAVKGKFRVISNVVDSDGVRTVEVSPERSGAPPLAGGVVKSESVKPIPDITKGVRVTTVGYAKDLKPNYWTSARNAQPEPFLGGKYELRTGNDGYYTVLDGGKPIASMRQGVLVVDKAYRRQGIATELVKRVLTDNPNYKPESLTPHSKKVFQKAVEELNKRKG